MITELQKQAYFFRIIQQKLHRLLLSLENRYGEYNIQLFILVKPDNYCHWLMYGSSPFVSLTFCSFLMQCSDRNILIKLWCVCAQNFKQNYCS